MKQKHFSSNIELMKFQGSFLCSIIGIDGENPIHLTDLRKKNLNEERIGFKLIDRVQQRKRNCNWDSYVFKKHHNFPVSPSCRGTETANRGEK